MFRNCIEKLLRNRLIVTIFGTTLELPTHLLARLLKFAELFLNSKHEENHGVNDMCVGYTGQQVDRSTGRQLRAFKVVVIHYKDILYNL